MVFETPDDQDAYLATPTGEYMSSMAGYVAGHGVPTRFTAVEDFHLFTNEYIHTFQEDLVRCLADLILRWLCDGDATLVCPTYDIYLRTIIEIIAVWNGEPDRSGYRASGEGLPIRERGMFSDVREMDYAHVFPTITRVGAEVDMTNHPAFDRTVYEIARSGRAQQGSTPPKYHNWY